MTDMGLGKTFTGAEKMKRLSGRVNLVICQKSKINDWIEHFAEYYMCDKDISEALYVRDLTCKTEFENFIVHSEEVQDGSRYVGIINYDLIFRRPELAQIKFDTIMLDESSLIQNESSKRSKFILKRLSFNNIILLSGTPTGGKYENLWSQLHLLGWEISKDLYWKQYIDFEWQDFNGFPMKVVKGYKNVERLRQKLKEHGAQFLKTEDVLDLPKQIHQTIDISTTREYRKFRKDCIIKIDDLELVGDTTLTKMLYERQLCGQYNEEKIKAFGDLLESTNDRLIVFYNFNEELYQLLGLARGEYDRHFSIVNGQQKDLWQYEEYDDTITFVQYQAGAMGLNLQKANKIIYFTPPLSSELFEQSKKRIHRIGQQKSCFYYYLTCKSSIEEKIYATLAMRKDYTDKLFERGD